MTHETPPAGTHGALVPPGPVLRLGSLVFAVLYRLTAGLVIGRSALLLITVGGRSGRRRVVMVRRFDDGDGRWLVVGSMGGAAKHPAWIYNLERNPDQVWIEIRRERWKVRPELLTSADRQDAWSRIVTERSQFAGYQARTDREIPVVRLTREALAAS